MGNTATTPEAQKAGSARPVGRLLQGEVATSLREMSVPMVVGLIAMILVNLVDTYWVSRLGTEALAAMTFTFPVESIVINIALGLMIGTSVAVSRAIGGGKSDEARLLTTHATVLAVIIVSAVSGLGLAFQEPLFRAMGAEGPLLNDVQSYMTPWFIGVAFLVVPMIANGALRASGDARTPSRIMVAAAILNAVLDPIFIFGWGPVPALGLQGAAIATVIARFVTMVAVFVVLLRNTALLGFAGTTARRLRDSWTSVGRVAVPAMVTNAVGPFAVGILTTMLASYGPASLAAWGIGIRVDAVLMLVPSALSSALSPFVGQNWGAHLRARVADAVRKSLWFAVIWGAAAAALLMAVAPMVAKVFSQDPAVQDAIVVYLRIIPIGYTFVGTVAMCSSTFNAVDRATRSTILSTLRSLGFAVPLAWLGSTFAGVEGLLMGLVVASIAAALLGTRWMKTYLAPLGDDPPGVGLALDEARLVDWLKGESGWSSLKEHATELLQMDALKAYAISSRRVGLYVGARVLVYLDEGGQMSIPMPMEVGENLRRFGSLEPHPDHEDNGWYRFALARNGDPDTARWLIGLSHLLYALSQRGAADPITQKEMDAYTRSPQCVAAMTAAAERWDAIPQAARAQT